MTGPTFKPYMMNKARSFIFSTGLPPITALWSIKMFEYARKADDLRSHLGSIGLLLRSRLGLETVAEKDSRHIIPFFTGSAQEALSLSANLLCNDIKVMAIRPPTVAPGTERLRISVSAAHTSNDINALTRVLKPEPLSY